MPAAQPREVTQLLRAWGNGDAKAFDQLVPLVYAELRNLARHRLRSERAGHTLQTTALVHEAYLRLAGATDVDWHNRIQFFAVCAKVMRHVLVDAARARNAAKRGGGVLRVPLGAGDVPIDARGTDVMALDDALNALAQLDPRKVQVVELRYFAGLSVQETAAALGVSPETVMRDWKLAKLWLLRELRRGTSVEPQVD